MEELENSEVKYEITVSKSMSSVDASIAFKQKVNECLSFIGLLNIDDKADIWRFWKTVSSAVKIAVNGKGHIGDKIHQNPGILSKLELLSRHLDPVNITVYIPIPDTSSDSQFRIVKLANQENIVNYFESIALNGVGVNYSLSTTDNRSDVYFEVVLEKTAKPTCDDDLSVSNHIEIKQDTAYKTASDSPDMLNEAKNTQDTIHDICVDDSHVLDNEATNGFLDKQELPKKKKPEKIAWPPSRPVTRRTTKSSVVKQKTASVYDSVQKDSSLKTHINDSDYGTASIRNEDGLTVVTLNGTTMTVGLDTNNDQQVESAQSSMNSQDSSLERQSISAVVETNLQVEQLIKQEPTSSEVQKDISFIDECIVQASEGESLNDTQIEKMKHEQTMVQMSSHESPQTNTSQIETIISALEQELKKNDEMNSKGQMEISNETKEVKYIDSSTDQFFSTLGSSVQLMDAGQIVEVQHIDNVVWTQDGEIVELQTEAHEQVHTSHEAVDAGYDVVECEVEERTQPRRRGRKKKRKFEEEYYGGESGLDSTCEVCHKTLNFASSMAAHMRTHTGVRPYHCSHGQCERKFTTKANRDRHEATHVGLKPFSCPECKKCFTEKRSLHVHMRTHTGDRPFVCTICEAAFTQKCTLQVHMHRHTNKKGHLCDLCGKAFRQKCQLDIHVLRHQRLSKYPCDQCPVRCYSNGDLVRHKIKHTGERPFACKECPKTFTRKQYLVDHENWHFNRMPYKCSMCGVAFHDMGSCHRHLRKHKQEQASQKAWDERSAILTSGDFHRILEGTNIGQVLQLEDGTSAVVKEVESEADGSMVYHITCLKEEEFKSTPNPNTVMMLPLDVDNPTPQADHTESAEGAFSDLVTHLKMLNQDSMVVESPHPKLISLLKKDIPYKQSVTTTHDSRSPSSVRASDTPDTEPSDDDISESLDHPAAHTVPHTVTEHLFTQDPQSSNIISSSLPALPSESDDGHSVQELSDI